MLKIFCLIVNLFVFSAFAGDVKVELKNATPFSAYVDIYINDFRIDFRAIPTDSSSFFNAKNGDKIHFFVGDLPAHSHKKKTDVFRINNNSRSAEFTISSGKLQGEYSVTVNQK